jgi:hypothetical protein
VDCDILTQGLIGLIEYLYHQGIASFPEAQLKRTLSLACLAQSNFRIGDRSESLPGCAQVRTKVCRKEYGWSVGLVYDPRRLPGVTTARPRVAGVLHFCARS